MKKNCFLFIALGVLVSCSLYGDWWYGRLDTYLANYFFEYADFSKDQKGYIRKVTLDFKEWHFENELPKYQNFLKEIKNFNSKTTVKEIKELYSKGYKSFKSSNEFFLPHMIDLAQVLNDQQINQIEAHFNEIIMERKKDLQKIDEESLLQETIKNSINGFRRMGVKLNEDQQIVIENHVNSMEDLRNESIRAQNAWNKNFIRILRERENKEFKTKLKKHLEIMDKMGGKSYQLKVEKNRLIFFEIFSDTISSFNENQLETYQDRIDYFLFLIERILKT